MTDKRRSLKEVKRLENLATRRQADEKRRQDFQAFSTLRRETHATAMGEGIIVLDKSGRVVEHIAYRNRSGTCEEVDWAIPPLRTNGVLGKRPLYPEKYEGPTPAVGDECLILDWPTWEANHKAEFYLAILLNLFIFYYESGIIEIRMQFLRKVIGTTFLIPPLDFMDTTSLKTIKIVPNGSICDILELNL